MSQPIAVVEPQLEGVFHAPLNAAFLHTVVLAYPDTPISFHAVPSHARAVQEILSQHAPGLASRIGWNDLSTPTGASLLARWRHNRRLFCNLLALGHRILFCSMSRMQLLQLKRLMLRRKHDTVRVVLHGELDLIEDAPQERFPMSLFSLHRVLLRPQPSGLRYLLLGRSIHNSIPEQYRHAFANAGICDHPYHFSPPATAAESPMVLGVFGNSGDGRLLEAVARNVRAASPSIRFRLIGFLSDQATVERLRSLVEDVGDQPITRQTFVERGNGITDALWLAFPGSFRLRASGTFFDALSYAKPLIYTANAFIDSYHALEPGIGWRCETSADVPETILRLAQTRTSETYAAARAAILRLRERFTPQAQAKLLPIALDWD